MIVEYCGVPGGGKSTLVAAYAREYPDTLLVTLPMKERLPEAWYALLFALTHPFSFVSLCRYALQYHARGLFWYSLHYALRACAKYEKASLTRSAPVHLDEGLVQALIVIPGRTLLSTEMEHWMKRIPLPRAVVFSRVGTFHRFHREDANVHPRLTQSAEALAAWEKAVKNNAQLVERMLTASIPFFALPERETETSETVRALHTFLSRFV